MGRLLLRLLPALLLVGVAVVFFASGASAELTPSGLAAHAQAWRVAAAREPVQSLAIYVAAYAILTAAGMPIAMGLTIAGGLIFGPVVGGFAALGSASAAALIGYAAARSALGPVVAQWLGEGGGKAAAFIEALRARAFWPIVAGRLMPIMPFPLINYAAGVARVPPGAFLAATVAGGIPSAFLFATLGSGLGANLSATGLGQAVRSPQIWGPLLALSVLSALPVVLRARRRASASNDAPAETKSPRKSF